MGCRPFILLIVVAALPVGTSLAFAPPAADLLPAVPLILPVEPSGQTSAGVPTVEQVLVQAASPDGPAAPEAPLTQSPLATTRPVTDAVGVYVVRPSPAGPTGTPWTPVAPADPAPGSFLDAVGQPFVVGDWDAPESRTYASGAASVPPPPVFAPTSGAITPRGDFETQDAGARRLVEVPLLGTPLTAHHLVGALAGLALLTLVPWALYHRIRGNSTLENRTRKAIYDLIITAPGSGVQEIAAAAGVTYSTASYHLDRLLGAGMVVVSAEGSRLRYYKNGGQFSEEERKILPILESAEACRVLEAILDRPYTYRAAIAERLGVSTTTVNWHLRRLLDLGLVHEAREGRSAHLYADRGRLATLVVPLTTKLPDASDGVRRIAARMEPPEAPVLAA